MTQEEAPWFPRKRSMVSMDLLVEIPQAHLASQKEVPSPPDGGPLGLPGSPGGDSGGPPGPLGGGSLGPPGDSGYQGPPRQSFMWQGGSALDQNFADMNRSAMQLLTAQQAANMQL